MKDIVMASEEMPTPAPDVIFELGAGFRITNTMVSVFITAFLLIAIAVIVRVIFIPRWRKNPNSLSTFRFFVEWLVSSIDRGTKDVLGHNSTFFSPWFVAVVPIIFIGVMIELLGFRPILTDLNFALVLSLTTFFWIHFFGFREKKARRFLHYINPINIVTDAVVPFSMALRMFGSVFSGYLIMHLFATFNIGIQIIGTLIGSLLFTLFHALIQSYVFYMLSISFIGEATE